MSSVVELERAGAEHDSALVRCAGDTTSFLRDVWGRRALVREAGEPRGFADLLTLDDVDRILSTSSVRTPSFRLVRAGEQIPESAYTRSGTTGSKPVSGMADPARIFELFRSGATIVLQGLHRYWEPVTRFLRDLELDLGHPCQVNAYITPPGAQGLALHADAHDVFVLQAFGRKSWEVHRAPGEPERGPIRAQLAPGGAIYMPEGTPHAASTQETLSGHLTVGVNVIRWRELLDAAWRRTTGDPTLDEPLPAGWTRVRERVAAELAARLSAASEALERVDPREVVEERAITFGSTRASLLRGALADLTALGWIDDRTLLERRPGAVCELLLRGDVLVALLGDRRLEMPVWLRPAMDRIASNPRLRVSDLRPDIPDPASRLVLMRRLVREGLISPVR
ncbi:MAG: cupin domain-containing protein [Actinobacteria bacterium]|nr:cupin domain-containing protein [Actinomycetota bacterium]